MLTTMRGVQWLAVAGAIGLLVLQIIGGLEYTEGGSLYAKSSMVAAMITLAFLPVFIEVARQAKAYGIALALAVAFCAFLAFSLPATVGRTNEVREVKAAEAQQSSFSIRLIEGELAKAQSRLNEAYIEVGRECRTGFGAKCEGWRNSVVERQFRVDAIQKELMAAKPKMGDMGSEAWASVAGIGAATVRQLSSLSFGLGLDVVIWALMWFATSAKVRGASGAQEMAPARKNEDRGAPEYSGARGAQIAEIPGNSPSDPRPRKRTTRQKRRDRVVAAIRKQTLEGKRPTFKLVKARYRLPNATASRYMKEAAA